MKKAKVPKQNWVEEGEKESVEGGGGERFENSCSARIFDDMFFCARFGGGDSGRSPGGR